MSLKPPTPFLQWSPPGHSQRAGDHRRRAADQRAIACDVLSRGYRLASEPELLETLRLYFALNQHRKAVAAKLKIHPNTLDHRLHRIEAMVGGPLSDTNWIVKLHTVLRLSLRRGDLRL